MGNRVVLSLVVPVMNEAGNITELVSRIDSVVDDLDVSWELLLIDDGSTDDTWRKVQEVASRKSGVEGISLSRNFGHQNALLAGLQYASGDAILSLDGDLQHPPEVIPDLLEEWRNGADVVTTRRLPSPDTSLFKRLTSRYFYRIFSWLSGLQAQKGTSDFRLVDRRVVEALAKMHDPDPFLRGMVDWVGFNTESITYRAEPRAAGESKYDLKNMLDFASSAVVSFSTLPLKVALWVGYLTAGFSFVMIIYSCIRFFQGETVPGWTSLLTFSALMFGTLFVMLGIIGLYLASIHKAVKDRPRYLVQEVTTDDDF